MDPVNIATLVTTGGEVYAYAGSGAAVRKYHVAGLLQNGQGVGQNSMISVTPTPADGYAVAAAFQPGPDLRHVFYQPAADILQYFVDAPPAADQNYQAHVYAVQAGDVGGIKLAGSFAAVSHFAGVVLVGFEDAGGAGPQQVLVVTIPWASLQPSTWMSGARVTKFPVDLGTGFRIDPGDCDLDATLYTDPTDASTNLLWVQRSEYSDGRSFLDARIVKIADDLTIAGTANFCEIPVVVPASRTLAYPKVMTRPDNVIELLWFDDDWVARRASCPVSALAAFFDGGQRTAYPEFAPETTFTVADAMSRGQGSGVQYGNNAYDLLFVPGPTVTSPGTGNPDLTDAATPLYAAIVYWSNGNFLHQISTAAWVSLIRSGLAPATAKRILLGIIEGPPPVPAENLNISSAVDPYTYFGQPGRTEIDYASVQSDESGLALDWGATAFLSVQLSQNAGIDIADAFAITISAKESFEMTAAYKGSYTESTKTTLTVSSNVLGKMTTTDGTYSILNAGMLIVMDADWTGYAYRVLSADGQQVAGAVQYVQIFPTNVAVSSMPYSIPPAPHGPTNGDLSTYVLDADEEQALAEQSNLKFAGGENFLTNTWHWNGGTSASYASLATSTWTHSFSVDLKALVGAAMVTKWFGIGGGVEITTSLTASFSSKWTFAKSTGSDVGTVVQLRANSQLAGTYTQYEIHMFQLGESQQWTTDLLSGIVTPTFPSDPYERAQNQEVLDQILPTSTPWKICYSVDPTSIRYNQPAATVVDGLPDHHAQELTGAFHAAGIDTTRNVEDVITAARAVADGNPAPALSLRPGADPQHADALVKHLAGHPELHEALASALHGVHSAWADGLRTSRRLLRDLAPGDHQTTGSGADGQ